MPRYHFHVFDGDMQADAEGVMLSSLEAARVEAQRFAGEIIRDAADGTDFGKAWWVEVTDEADIALFHMGFTVSEPALSIRPKAA